MRVKVAAGPANSIRTSRKIVRALARTISVARVAARRDVQAPEGVLNRPGFTGEFLVQ